MCWLRAIASLLAALVPVLGQTNQPPQIQYFIESVAGSNFVGDGQVAVAAQLAAAEGLAFDPAGNLYIADSIDHRIRRVDASDGTITTVAGNGHSGSSGDGGSAGRALLNSPYGLAFDSIGTLYVADFGNGRVRAISPDGDIRTVAGGFLGPRNVAVDSSGNLFVSDFADHRVYRVTPDGRITVVAGTGYAGFSGDGLATSSHLNAPAGLAVSRDGSLYIADTGNNCIRLVRNGILSTVLGATAGGADLAQPTGLALDHFENLYVADSGNQRILVRQPYGRVTVLGTAAAGLTTARNVVVSPNKSILVADGRRVVRLNVNGSLDTVAGNGSFGVTAEGAPAVESYLGAPVGVAVDATGNLLIADEAACRVLRVDSLGAMTTAAGTGVQG
ncbi:MAG: hypothetical protein GY953_19600, partial [bacterium]|nr:hypothetical protein [bacterium]